MISILAQTDVDASTATAVLFYIFAIMSGGHASNPGFSSTTGVHISLKQFNKFELSEDNSTVEVGTGWVSSCVARQYPSCGFLANRVMIGY